jgi:transposase InsO family protein
MIDEAVAAGAREPEAAKLFGLHPRTVQRWRKEGAEEDRRCGPKQPPKNKLSEQEREEIYKVLISPEFRDCSPKQIVPKLADREIYLASDSTLYRILRSANLQRHRTPSRVGTKRHKPLELRSTGPNQVWSWDITYLKSPVKGVFFYLYLIVDIWSRKVVGSTVEERESAEHATALLSSAYERESVAPNELSIHNDNGSPFKAATLLARLQTLGIVPSYSRPRVSNDNPFPESLFRTLKYRPEYPAKGPFASLEQAKEWTDRFVHWYNHEHQHSGIGFVTPAERHAGQANELLQKRDKLYREARRKNPKRWSGKTRNWEPVNEVVLNPAKEPPLENVA